MPPKSRSKTTKTTWKQCSICMCYISSLDEQAHADICKLGEPADLHSVEMSNVEYGFCTATGGIFVGLLTVRDDLPEHIPSSMANQLLYMHSSTLRLIGCGIGQPVVVNGHHVFTAWPSSSAGTLTTVGVSSFSQSVTLGLKAKTGVVVTPLMGPRLPATSIHVSGKEQCKLLKNSGFEKYVLRHFGGMYVTLGTILHFSFYGQSHRLVVAAVTNENQSSNSNQEPTNENVSSSRGAICDRLAHLQIKNAAPPQPNFDDDKIDMVVSPTMTSTPSKRPSHHGHAMTSSVAELVRRTQNLFTQFYQIDDRTRFEFADSASDDGFVQKEAGIDELGGLDSQIETIRNVMSLCLNASQVFLHHALPVPRGILLHGPTGTGKTMLARAIISDTPAHVITVNGPEIWSKYFGESEAKLISIFKEARQRAPSIVFLDELDSFCPRRDSAQSDVEKRVVSALLGQLDAPVGEAGNIFVIAATNKRDDIDPALRRAGRLDREIEIGVPTAAHRVQIMSKMLQRIQHTISESGIRSVAEQCHGFVGADLSAVCKQAGIHALKRKAEDVVITGEDLHHGMQSVQPSAMREVAIEIPQVRWEDIGGQTLLKMKLRQAIEWPLRHPEAFTRLGVRPPRGLLMYGPPGCSKTMVAKALARESGINFIAIKGPELFSKWVGESERAVREVFRRARSAAPAIVFFDEIDAIAGERGSGGGAGVDVTDRVLAQLLTEMDGVEALTDVTVVAATNRPDRIDKALLRPGRLDRIVYVCLPDEATRRQIFSIQFLRTSTAEDVSLDDLVARTNGYSGAEIVAVCQEAALAALQADMQASQVHAEHFRQALDTVQPRTTKEMIAFYANYQQSSGLHAI